MGKRVPTMADFGLDLVDCLLLWTEIDKMKGRVLDGLELWVLYVATLGP